LQICSSFEERRVEGDDLHHFVEIGIHIGQFGQQLGQQDWGHWEHLDLVQMFANYIHEMSAPERSGPTLIQKAVVFNII